MEARRPRVILSPDRIRELRHERSGGGLRFYLDHLDTEAAGILALPPLAFAAVSGNLGDPADNSMLHAAREALRRVVVCSLRFLIDDDAACRDRAVEELRSLASWPTWTGPYHGRRNLFALETAECAVAAAVGLDWLYDVLPAGTRTALSDAIVSRALVPYRAASERDWWCRSASNWNAVCNGGAYCAAAALRGTQRGEGAIDLAAIAGTADAGIASFLDRLPEDGAYPEGTGYQAYAFLYLSFYARTRRNATGNDGGVFAHPGVRAAPDFFMAFMPRGLGVGFSDNSVGHVAPRQAGLIAAAVENGRGDFLSYLERYRRPHFLDPLFAVPSPVDGGRQESDKRDRADGLLGVSFRSIGWACLEERGADGERMRLALKGGDMAAGHAHRDLGGFVLDAYGERLIVDQGGGAYSDSYFDPAEIERHFQRSTRAHSLMMPEGASLRADANGRLSPLERGRGSLSVVLSSEDPYPGISRWNRRATLFAGEGCLIEDEAESVGDGPLTTIRFLFHTFRSIEEDGTGCALCGDRARLLVRPLDGLGTTPSFAGIVETPIVDGESAGAVDRCAVFELHAPRGRFRAAFLLTPSSAGGAAPVIGERGLDRYDPGR